MKIQKIDTTDFSVNDIDEQEEAALRALRNTSRVDARKKKKSHGFLFYFFRFFFLFIILGIIALFVFGWNLFHDYNDNITVIETDSNNAYVGSGDKFDYSWIAGDNQNELFTKNNDKFINLLLLGTNDELSDTIMVANINLRDDKVSVISIPRDTFYDRDVSGIASLKINSIYRGENVKEIAKAVSDTLGGMPIHYYAAIDSKGVKAVIDKMGGVPMNIPFDMNYEDPYDDPPLKIHLKKGYQVLDGEHAVQFLRYRHGYPEGDIGRVKAHQQFIKSAFRETIGLGLPGIVKESIKQVDTNMPLKEALKISTKLIGIEKSTIQTYVLPGYAEPYKGASFYFRSDEDVEELVECLYNGEAYGVDPASITPKHYMENNSSSGKNNASSDDQVVTNDNTDSEIIETQPVIDNELQDEEQEPSVDPNLEQEQEEPEPDLESNNASEDDSLVDNLLDKILN